MPAMTRGPLPPRVYWVRRLLVLCAAALLLVGIARLLSGSSDGSAGEGRAAQAAADANGSAGDPDGTAGVSGPPPVRDSARTGKHDRPRKQKASHEPVLAVPDGTCADEDIAVSPKVEDPVAGRPVTIVLQLRTLHDAACTWEVSRHSVTVAITHGKKDVWSSRQCRRAVPTKEVVVRQAVTTDVGLVWDARYSDERCSRLTEWAMPGSYEVSASALGGEPAVLDFDLATPTSETITKTAKPKQSEEPDRKRTR
jgi:hypothetical protein